MGEEGDQKVLRPHNFHAECPRSGRGASPAPPTPHGIGSCGKPTGPDRRLAKAFETAQFLSGCSSTQRIVRHGTGCDPRLRRR